MKNFTFDSLECAIFDLDGTLVDSMKLWRRMFYDYLEAKNIEPEADIDEKTYPMTIIQAADYLNVTYKLGLTREQVIDGCNDLMAANYKQVVPLKPFVREFLDILYEHKIPMFIATATDRRLVEVCLESLNIGKYFSGIVTSTEAGCAKAESAKIFDMAREKSGAKKEKSVIFEDSYHAIRQAKKEGYSIAALYDAGAEGTLDNIKETADWYSETFEWYVNQLVK